MSSSISPLAPIHFFRLHVDLKEGKKTLLPNTSELLGEKNFSEIAITWQPSGLRLYVHVQHPFQESVYPKFTQGDALEFFFDTRDLKEAGAPSCFCHHFLILPQEIQGVRTLELTRFRAEEARPLADPARIEIAFRPTSKEYFMELHFPADILHGYDPYQFDRLGLTYTIHRAKGSSQNFSVASNYVSIAQNPSLWASCKLAR